VSGTLYVVGTPIGNLADFTRRAESILQSVDIIAAEDTRVSRKLLNHYDIKTPLIAYHDKNEQKQAEKLVGRLILGENIALISDAGTPCISDPGYRLVHQAQNMQIKVLTIPGPSAVIAALSISGIPTDHYYFEGFLPTKKGRKTRFELLETLPATIVIYESPVRVLRTLRDIEKYLGDRVISICREMTKIYEETFVGMTTDAIKRFENLKPKGEFVIMIAKNNYELKNNDR
tara:strand:+ start:5159 stop:5854 length:696 start_codon:yes stop_codon:yes gene_type:complete